ncbi:MAG: ribosome recycling factor [Clostridia bacterium]|nr:ribosome recycling factor [Clostridia bacterium]
MKELFNATKERMEKSLVALNNEFNSIRAGRASAASLDRISVDYYGAPTPINQMAAISVTDGRTLVIQPWDKTSLDSICKAIQASELGINPQNDGVVIRLNFPQPTEERRRELVKEASKKAEDAKVAIRSIRRDSMDKLKAMKKDSVITEDDQRDGEKQLQDITDKYVKEIDVMYAKKEKEILEI